MCGAVRYVWTGEPLHVGYCHCRSCRHHSGAAVAGMLVFESQHVSITAGVPGSYASSPGVARQFCTTCGTSLTWQAHGLTSIHIGTLDDPNAHAPTLHWRAEERAAWFDGIEQLPHAVLRYPGPSPQTV
ncbi:MAG: GFA family protein [Pseudomonadota bacterium]